MDTLQRRRADRINKDIGNSESTFAGIQGGKITKIETYVFIGRTAGDRFGD